MEIFTVSDKGKDGLYTVRHVPSGLGCGYFNKRKQAKAFCDAANALVEATPSLKEVKPDRGDLAALRECRVSYYAAD